MMGKLFGVLAVLLAAALAALYFLLFQPQGLSLSRAQDELLQCQRDVRICAQETSSLNSRVAELEGLLSELRQTGAELETRVAEKEAELARAEATQEELVAELEDEIARGQIQVARLRGELRVDLVDEILFDSGAAEVKPEGREVLRRIGEVLSRTDKRVRVQGHTDDVPIRGQLAARYPTNWELSAARAVNVVRFLQEEARLAPSRLSAAGFSEFQPRAGNDTEKGRAQNRRIEIQLAPPLEVAELPGA
jgi:chemotaxis protein MotB